mmetsp:Transcript_7332/g.23456  ORF Transcript_7332/g.23456 Transcript_7332/m.23456 type:complete len:215 (-) Transcript_7332:13-657(-)
MSSMGREGRFVFASPLPVVEGDRRRPRMDRNALARLSRRNDPPPESSSLAWPSGSSASSADLKFVMDVASMPIIRNCFTPYLFTFTTGNVLYCAATAGVRKNSGPLALRWTLLIDPLLSLLDERMDARARASEGEPLPTCDCGAVACSAMPAASGLRTKRIMPKPVPTGRSMSSSDCVPPSNRLYSVAGRLRFSQMVMSSLFSGVVSSGYGRGM